MNRNSAGELVGERHGRGLQDDEEWANLLFCKLAGHPVCMNVVSLNMDMISYVERRELHASLVGESGHVNLRFLYVVAEELVSHVEVDCRVACMKVGDSSVGVNGNEGVVALRSEEW